VGCLNYTVYKRCNKKGNISHFGVDYVDPTENLPENYKFSKVDLNKNGMPYSDDLFDLIVANHVIEHLTDPIRFFGECLRVLKPGGRLYLSAPSEKSIKRSGMSFDLDSFYSLSFYDDPTHQQRPWPPGAFHRLSKYFSAIPQQVGYISSLKAKLAFPFLYPLAKIMKNGKLLERLIWNATGWSSFAVIKKPEDVRGSMNFQYYIPERKIN